jgi:2-dehydropantoate 2-reductase
MRKKVLVCGAGVIGSIYAVRFANAGFDVTVLARGDRLRAISCGGLRLRYANLRLEEQADVRCVESLDPAMEYDLALVTVRAPQIMAALASLAGTSSRAPVVVIGNNFQGHEEQRTRVGSDRYVLGFGSFGGFRDEEAVTYLDGRTINRPRAGDRRPTTLGVISPEAIPALMTVEEMFRITGLPTRRSADMTAWLKCHAAVVFPLAGAIYATGADQGRASRTRDAVVIGLRACRELLRALRGRGVAREPRALGMFLAIPEPLMILRLSRMLIGKEAAIALFGHANAQGGRREIADQALKLDAFVRTAGSALENWSCLLPYFDPANTAALIPDGSRAIRLRAW